MPVGVGADFYLALIQDRIAVLADGIDPVFDVQHARPKGAIRSLTDGCQSRLRQEQIAETGAVFVCRAADRIIKGLCQLFERCGGRAWLRGCLRRRCGVLREERAGASETAMASGNTKRRIREFYICRPEARTSASIHWERRRGPIRVAAPRFRELQA